jgi:hypothetical protein
MSNEVPLFKGASSRKEIELDAEDLAPVNPSNKKEGKEITLEEVLPFFKSFYKTKPYVSLVGGLANNGKTQGDIDVFIRSKTRSLRLEA